MDKHISKGTPNKLATVTKLTDKVNKATSLVFVDYRGLKHKQLEGLRKSLRKLNADFTVAKNRLLLKALGGKAEGAKEYLSETTATLFAYSDEVSPLKELLKFMKIAGFGKAKAGILGNTMLTGADVAKLASLPPREALLGKLVSQLNAPIQGLHYALAWNMNKFVWALNTVREKKGMN